jgi:hypothetical protein
MKTNEFQKIVENRIARINEVLNNKAKEYSSNTDRLHNFKVAAQIASTPITHENALWGMMRKHLVSVIDIIDNTANGVYPNAAMRDEKIGDAVNYFILLEALLIENSPPEPAQGLVVEGTCATLNYKPDYMGAQI